MTKIDDYTQACELGKKALQGKDPEILAEFSGALYQAEGHGAQSLTIRFLNREILISWPDLNITENRTREKINIQQQVFLLHYLNGAFISGGAPLTNEWISFQEIPDGKFYLAPFISRARAPLLSVFGKRPGLMVELASEAYDASGLDHGDHSVSVEALPLVRLALILWDGDDEFSPESNILFDKNISRLLSAEDIAWLAGNTVYPLMGMARGK